MWHCSQAPFLCAEFQARVFLFTVVLFLQTHLGDALLALKPAILYQGENL